MELSHLLTHINEVHSYFQSEAVRQVNTALSLRNWLIGYYLYEYEQHGKDRAAYGERLYKVIAGRLKSIKGLSERALYTCIEFYKAYPQILQTVSAKFNDKNFIISLDRIGHLEVDNTLKATDADLLLSRLSFSHFIELLQAETPLKRTFYEGDNPPVGIILCAQKNDTLVHYATGSLSQQIFVSKYLVHLPKEEELKTFIDREQAFLSQNNRNV